MIYISHILFQDWTVNHKQGSTTMAGIPTTAEPHHRTPRSPESNQQNGGRIQAEGYASIWPPLCSPAEPRILEHSAPTGCMSLPACLRSLTMRTTSI